MPRNCTWRWKHLWQEQGRIRLCGRLPVGHPAHPHAARDSLLGYVPRADGPEPEEAGCTTVALGQPVGIIAGAVHGRGKAASQRRDIVRTQGGEGVDLLDAGDGCHIATDALAVEYIADLGGGTGMAQTALPEARFDALAVR